MRLGLAICLGSLALSYSYVLDSSCTQYEDLIIKGMKGALDFAQAAADIFSSPSADTNIFQAQQELISFMFAAALKDPASKKNITARFAEVLKYNVNGGEPTERLDSVNDKDVYPTLTDEEIVFFCDKSRMKEGGDCNKEPDMNTACDSLMLIGKSYFYTKKMVSLRCSGAALGHVKVPFLRPSEKTESLDS